MTNNYLIPKTKFQTQDLPAVLRTARDTAGESRQIIAIEKDGKFYCKIHPNGKVSMLQ